MRSKRAGTPLWPPNRAISADKLQRKIGTTIEVLIDHVSDDGALGRSMADAPEIDGVVHLPAQPIYNPAISFKVKSPPPMNTISGSAEREHCST